jgi:hypothetical protein
VVSSPFFYTKDEKTSKQKIRINTPLSLADISLGCEGIISKQIQGAETRG